MFSVGGRLVGGLMWYDLVIAGAIAVVLAKPGAHLLLQLVL
jgi:hypothetical protein